jgi:hypothetical protein
MKIALKSIISFIIPAAIFLFTNNFPAGAYLDGIWFRLYFSYFNDLVQPFGLYFFLGLGEKYVPILKPWRTKALIAFLIPTIMEIGQYFYRNEPGVSFDWVDILAYAIGVCLAALLERGFFVRVFKSW